MPDTLEELEAKVKKYRQARLKKFREHYALAKKLGLPSELAQVVCQKSETAIRIIAKEYKSKNK